jgi:hypothetical protein
MFHQNQKMQFGGGSQFVDDAFQSNPQVFQEQTGFSRPQPPAADVNPLDFYYHSSGKPQSPLLAAPPSQLRRSVPAELLPYYADSVPSEGPLLGAPAFSSIAQTASSVGNTPLLSLSVGAGATAGAGITTKAGEPNTPISLEQMARQDKDPRRHNFQFASNKNSSSPENSPSATERGELVPGDPLCQVDGNSEEQGFHLPGNMQQVPQSQTKSSINWFKGLKAAPFNPNASPFYEPGETQHPNVPPPPFHPAAFNEGSHFSQRYVAVQQPSASSYIHPSSLPNPCRPSAAAPQASPQPQLNAQYSQSTLVTSAFDSNHNYARAV